MTRPPETEVSWLVGLPGTRGPLPARGEPVPTPALERQDPFEAQPRPIGPPALPGCGVGSRVPLRPRRRGTAGRRDRGETESWRPAGRSGGGAARREAQVRSGRLPAGQVWGAQLAGGGALWAGGRAHVPAGAGNRSPGCAEVAVTLPERWRGVSWEPEGLLCACRRPGAGARPAPRGVGGPAVAVRGPPGRARRSRLCAPSLPTPPGGSQASL